MKRLLAFAVIGLLMSLATPASASTRVYVGVNLSLRAGPDIGYPRIMVVPAGAYISVQGCLNDWSWCDVIVDGHRGWIAATYLQSYYGGNWGYVPTYGPRIGIPIVSFVLSTYWGNYYRHRPWYRERDRWMRHPPRHAHPRRSPRYRPLPPPRSGPPAHRRPPASQPARVRPAARPAHRPAPQPRTRNDGMRGHDQRSRDHRPTPPSRTRNDGKRGHDQRNRNRRRDDGQRGH